MDANPSAHDFKTAMEIKAMMKQRVLFLRISATALLLAFLTPVAYSEVSFDSVKPIPRIEHWQRRVAEINSDLRDTQNLRQIKLLFVGDSITDFWLLDDDPWVSGKKFGRRVWNESFATPGSENYAFNIGISGDRIENVLYRIQPKSAGGLGQLDAAELSPEFIVFMLGINNTWAAEKPVADSVFEGVRATLNALHARKPKARIVLQSLLPTNDETKNRDVVRPVNQRLAKLITDQAFAGFTTYLDLYPAFVDGSGTQISGYFTDGLHPNEVGYRVWREKLVPFLQKNRK